MLAFKSFTIVLLAKKILAIIKSEWHTAVLSIDFSIIVSAKNTLIAVIINGAEY